MIPSYNDDFYAWTLGTANLLRQGRFNEVDFNNLIEEIESMGRSERNQLISRLAVLITHLLKWQFQPDFRGRSWQGTIKEQRLRLQKIIEDNPSLKSFQEDALLRAYPLACSMIEKETPIDLKLLPVNCSYTFDQCLDDKFYASENEVNI